MKNLSGYYTRKRALTASTKNKKGDAGLSDCKAKRGIVLCGTAEMEPGRESEKETTTAAIITGVLLAYGIPNLGYPTPSGKVHPSGLAYVI